MCMSMYSYLNDLLISESGVIFPESLQRGHFYLLQSQEAETNPDFFLFFLIWKLYTMAGHSLKLRLLKVKFLFKFYSRAYSGL